MYTLDVVCSAEDHAWDGLGCGIGRVEVLVDCAASIVEEKDGAAYFSSNQTN